MESSSLLRPIGEVWEWQLLGRCRGRTESQFFHPDDDPGHNSRRRREAAAKRVCHGCPVRRQCATHALTIGEEYGVWGGFSENDRIRLRRLEWQDTLDQHRLADVDTLEARLARARQGPGTTVAVRAPRLVGPQTTALQTTALQTTALQTTAP